MHCPIEVFTSIKPLPFRARSAPLRNCRGLKAIITEQQRKTINIWNTIPAPEQIRNEVSDHSHTRWTQAQKTHNVKASVLPINVDIGNYVIILIHSKPHYTVQSLWRGPKKIEDSTLDLVLFVVEGIRNQRRQAVHAQQIIPYPVAHLSEHASQQLRE